MILSRCAKWRFCILNHGFRERNFRSKAQQKIRLGFLKEEEKWWERGENVITGVLFILRGVVMIVAVFGVKSWNLTEFQLSVQDCCEVACRCSQELVVHIPSQLWSYWPISYLEIGHSGNIYYLEIGKFYKSGLGFSLPTELVVNHDQHTIDGKSFRI